MKTMKQNRPEVSLRLVDLLEGRDAWGTELGAKIFSQINVRLIGATEGTLVILDFADVRWSDVSFQREAVVETLRKHRPRILFVAVNLTDPDLRENLDLALDRRGEALILREGDGALLIGHRLTPEQRTTLEQIWLVDEVTSAGLVGDGGAKLSTISSRLAWLWKAGLLERVEGTSPSGGREHRYRPIM